MGLVAGVDCSTQSTKVLVVDEEGKVVASASAAHRVSGTGGARETDPKVWEDALTSALGATGRAGEITGIAVAGQQHGLVVVGDDGTPLRPAVLWNDTRSAPDALAIIEALGGPDATARLIGSVPSASFTVTSWAWLRRTEPKTAKATRAVRLPHDHLNACLTGEASTDRSDVSGTGWWSPTREAYAEEVLALPQVQLPISMLPTVRDPLEPAGLVSSCASRRFGLQEGTIVGCGAGDNAAGALPLALRPGEAALSLGTSGTVFAVTNQPSADPSGTVSGFASADGRFLPLACTLNATVAVDRVASWLGIDREAVEPSREVAFLPWLDGERTPNAPGASGTLTGLRHDTTPGGILQAAYEGVVATLLEATRVLGQWAPQEYDQPLVLIGGGAKGKVWQETVARLSGRPLLVPDVAEPVAYGAAMIAAAAAERTSLDSVAQAWATRGGRRIEAMGADQETFDRISSWRAVVLDSIASGSKAAHSA